MTLDNVVRCDCCTHRLARYTESGAACAVAPSRARGFGGRVAGQTSTGGKRACLTATLLRPTCLKPPMPNIHRLISQRIRTHTHTLILLACAATVIGVLAPATASASHTQTMYFEAPRDLVEVTPAARTKTLAQLQSLGVKALRVELDWANVAPGAHSTKKPTFEATNPAAYNWGAYD